MPFWHNIAELDRLWPIQGHGTRHSLDCHWAMLTEFNNPHIYAEIVCKCGLDVWLQMKQVKVGDQVFTPRKEFVCELTPCSADM